MAKKMVLACIYRYLESVEGKEDTFRRVVLNPGDDAKALSKEVRDDLVKRNLVIPAERLSDDGLRLAPDSESRQVEEEDATPKKQTGTKEPTSSEK